MPGSLTGDIDGDGQVDQVFLALDRTAPQGCQAFLVVQTPNTLLSSPVSAWESLGGLPSPRLHSLIQLNGSGDEVVVDVLAGASTQFVSVFTVVDGRLEPMSAPGVQTAGGVTTFPYSGSVGHLDGEDCTTDGHIEIVSASPKGNKYDVHRHVYSAQGAELKPLPSFDRTTTMTFSELSRLPGFASAPFGDCRP